MERESFEDAEVAALLNAGFVAVKVDREERPDIDAVYMSVCEALTGQGGWPLTVVMTPEQEPFFAATYLPKESRGGYRGLTELLPAILDLWKSKRDAVRRRGAGIAALLREQAAQSPPAESPSKALLRDAAREIGEEFDERYGGFSPAPKFPMPHIILFLMEYARRSGEAEPARQAEETLAHMYAGGLFDHIGGGFARYSTDKKWLAPHFEKMLYDNALLAMAYLQGYADAGTPAFRYAAEETLAFALRELRGRDGGFYCSEDADSEGEEGKFYLFTPDELTALLGERDGKAFCAYYGITAGGNFEGKSIPNLLGHGGAPMPDAAMLELRERVFRYRSARVPPATDDKQLTAWNALMIAALARAYVVLGERKYLDAAVSAQQNIEKRLARPDGGLYVRYRDGRADHDGQLSDYAFYGWALTELYAACFDAAYLSRAAELAGRMAEGFGSAESGFYSVCAEGAPLIARQKDVYDGALPSGNSAAALLLERLWRLTGEPAWRGAAERQLSFVAAHAARGKAGHCFGLLAVIEEVYPKAELIVVSREEGDWLSAARLSQSAKKGLAVLVKTPANEPALIKTAPFAAAYPYPQEGAAYYVCENTACKAPVYSLAEAERLL